MPIRFKSDHHPTTEPGSDTPRLSTIVAATAALPTSLDEQSPLLQEANKRAQPATIEFSTTSTSAAAAAN